MKLVKDLKAHDFFYEYTEDFNVWKQNKAVEQRLINELAELIPKHALMLIEAYVPKQYHRSWAFQITNRRKYEL
jgi:hypothetical protein